MWWSALRGCPMRCSSRSNPEGGPRSGRCASSLTRSMEALPAIGDRPTRRKTIVDAALDMADQLVTSHYNFLRSVVRRADRALQPDEEKQ
jgi:hypothetical protein